jgi:hypothetical protein
MWTSLPQKKSITTSSEANDCGIKNNIRNITIIIKLDLA